MTRILMAAAVLATFVAGTQALTASAGQSRGPANVELTANVDSARQVDNAPAGDSQGDMLVFTQKLTDARGRQRGAADAYCVRTAPGRMRECQGTYVLPRGQVFVTGPDPDGVKRHALAIVGGTGAYANVRGRVRLNHVTPTRDRVSFRFRR